MSFAEALAAAEKGQRRPCKLGRALELMDDGDRAAFADAAERGVAWTAIHRAVVAQGFDMTYATVQRHMRADCGCDG